MDSSKFEAFKKELLNSGVMIEDSKPFLKFVESNIYNVDGVSFKNLNNALKTLNSYYKQAKDPNFKDHIKKSLDNFLKNDIKNAIDSIFELNPSLASEAKELFRTALNDYAAAKTALKTIDSLKLRDKTQSYENSLKKLTNYAKGIGEENKPLLRELLKDLEGSNIEAVELHLLNDLMNKSFVDLGNDFRVFDSSAFFNRLKSLEAEFSSPAAKDYINLAEGFHTLFKNDAKIATALSKATSEKIGSSIATTLQGAIKFQAVKMMFEHLVRLMPNIPFMKSLNEKIEGAALRYHIKAALNKSIDVSDFKAHFNHRVKIAKFNNETLKATEKFKKALDFNPPHPPKPDNPTPKAQKGLDYTEPTRPAIEQDKNFKNSFSVKENEEKEIKSHFKFKNHKPLLRELRENEIKHALKSHGDEAIEKQRGNIAINRSDIEQNYPKITQDYDEKFFTDKGIIYVKQVNGHHIAIEEALLGQDKLIFKSLWKTRGKYNKAVLLKNAKANPYPHNADEAAKNKSISNLNLEQGYPQQYDLSAKNSTTNAIAKQETKEISQDLQVAWLKEFNLKSIDEDYGEIIGGAINAKEALKKGEEKIKNNAFETLNYKESREIIKENLKNIINKPLKSNDGIEARISNASIAKMTSSKAVQKSVDNGFSKSEHLEAVANLQNIYQNATLKESHADKKGSKDLVAIHRLTSNINDKTQALITLKESINNGKKIYSLELELNPALPIDSSPISKKAGDLSSIEAGATNTAVLLQKSNLNSTAKNINHSYDSKGEIIGGAINAKEALKKGEATKNKQESLQTYRTKEEKENFVKNYDFEKGAVEIPKVVNIKEFLESANNYKNKENFIKHLQNKEDSQSRLAYLNLIEPTFKEPNIKLINGERETYIKAFKSGNNIYEMLITQEGGKTLITSIPTTRLAYVKTKIKNADLIQTFTS